METENEQHLSFGAGNCTRSVFLVLLFLACATTSPQATGEHDSGALKNFHDDVLNITYFYPAEFVPAPPASTPALAGTSKCMQPTLFAYSVTPIENSSFALTTIDNTCPEILRAASQPGPFTREQIVRQLKQYGDPAIILAPTNYTIAGHPASITVASVTIPADPGKVAPILYAAKACALGSVPLRTRRKSGPVEPLTHVLCFDFNTQNRGMLTRMFSFIVQFENTPPEPMFPGSVIRHPGETSRR
jgi:hypothetical protein